MIRDIQEAGPQTRALFDEIIDVRSPGEFAEDHVPGAINLPVLSDLERAEVGTVYIQHSKFDARRMGAAYVSRNVARHLEGTLRHRNGAYTPLLYCWRGGQRSNAMATILSQVGWRVGLLQGGYKTYRRSVIGALYDAEAHRRLVVLDGGTGTGKTQILQLAAQHGLQTLDLEDLAAHRGSLFGGFANRPQPSQKMFESRLLAALERLDPARPIVVEGESSKIGDLFLPPRLWQAMAAAPRIELSAPVEARAAYLVSAYQDISGNVAGIEATLARLPVHHGAKRLEAWRELARAGELQALALGLIEAHYDPAYRRSAKTFRGPCLGVVALDDVGEASRRRVAEELARRVSEAFGDL